MKYTFEKIKKVHPAPIYRPKPLKPILWELYLVVRDLSVKVKAKPEPSIFKMMLIALGLAAE